MPAKKRRRRRSRGRKRVGLTGVLLFLVVTVVATAAVYTGYQWLRRSEAPAAGSPGSAGTSAPSTSPSTRPANPAGAQRRPRPALPPRQHPVSEPEPVPEAPGATAEPTPPAIPEPARVAVGSGEARVALVIDDLGRSIDDVAALERLGVPLTYAVLPFETATAEVAAALGRRGEEVIVHLPMQPADGADPGPGALLETMTDDELVAATRTALDAVPGAVGVNNHMGSVLSSDRRAMRAVLGVIAQRRLFFLDSRTSAETVAYRTATGLGIPAAERHVFLDPEPGAAAIRHQFSRLLDLARRRGSAVAIAHPHPTTLEVLATEIPEARRLGYELVPLSFLIEREGLPP
jgi:polysaccharide deacetylase 2 family uncharacterized protein YibQ